MELFPGWGFTEVDVIYANINLDEMAISIAAGQDAPSYGYGPSKFTGYDADTDVMFEDGEMITGTIDANGDIHIPHFTGQYITSGDNEGLWFDLWQYSDWAKTSAKNMNYVEISHNRQPRSK
jgi:hypothetical protein